MIGRRSSCSGWIVVPLIVLAGVAWLTQNPEAKLVEQAQEWPVVGGLAKAFRRAYLPPPPATEPLATSSEPEIEVLAPPPVDSSESRYVWVQPGVSLHAEPDFQSPILETVTSIRNLSVIRRSGDWYWVWVPRSGARPLRAWVRLEDYRHPEPEALLQADPVLPLPAAPPDPERIAIARGQMRDSGVEVGCGPQTIVTDAPETDVVRLCARLTGSLESLYRERYGLEPVGPPAEAILVFGQREAYLAFRDLEPVSLDTGLAHASPGRGYMALYTGQRPTGEVMATLVHESTHLLNRRSLGPALPAWLNEGMADDLAQSRIDTAGRIDPEKLGGEVRQEDGKIVRSGGLAAAIELQEAIRDEALPSLRDLVAMEEQQFHRADRVQLHYALSSLWVRYLVSDADPALRDGFRHFLQDIAGGTALEPELLTDRLARDWDELESDFRIWIHLQFVRPPSEESATSTQGFLLAPLMVPVRVVFLFPDRHFSFEALERSSVGLVGSGAVGRRHRNGHTGFSHRDITQAVGDANTQVGGGVFQLGGDGVQPLQGHGAVGVVGDTRHLTVLMSLADVPDKHQDRAARWMRRGLNQQADIDGLVHQPGPWSSGAARNRWQQGHLGTVSQGGLRARQLTIDCDRQSRPQGDQAGVVGSQPSGEIGHGRTGLDLELDLVGP